MEENNKDMGTKKPWYEKVYNSVATFWNFMDGKKNKIGNAALAVYGVAETAVSMGIIPDHTLAAQAVLYAGLAFKVIGISHKVSKGEIEIELPSGLSKNKQAE